MGFYFVYSGSACNLYINEQIYTNFVFVISTIVVIYKRNTKVLSFSFCSRYVKIYRTQEIDGDPVEHELKNKENVF